jgi:toxin ParE1/3/4
MPERSRPPTWSPEARADLSDIWTYYAEVAGPQTADNAVRQIGGACGSIARYPLGGRARDEVRPGLRSLAVRAHVVFYRLRDGAPEIVRVLDARRDLDEPFGGDLSGP